MEFEREAAGLSTLSGISGQEVTLGLMRLAANLSGK
jgi:hypothetical protein